MTLFSNDSVSRRISGIVVVVAVVEDVAIVLEHALGNVELVVEVGSVANIGVVDNQPVVEQFSVYIAGLFDLAVLAVAAVAGMHRLMCSLRVKVAPNR